MSLVVREHRQPAKHTAEAPLEQGRARHAHQSRSSVLCRLDAGLVDVVITAG